MTLYINKFCLRVARLTVLIVSPVFASQYPDYVPTNIVVSVEVKGFSGFVPDAANTDIMGSNVVYQLWGQAFTNQGGGIIEITTNELTNVVSSTPWAAIALILNAYKRMDVDELASMTIESGRDRMSQNLISGTRRDALVSMFSRLTGAVVVVGYDKPPLGFVTYTRLEYNDGTSVLSPFLCRIEQGQYRMAPFSGTLSALDSNLANGLKTNGFGQAVKVSY